MAGPMDASRDLRLGLFALESGAIDHEQFISAVRSWSRSGDRSLSSILAGRGLLDAPTLARLEVLAARDPGSAGGGLASGPDPTATFEHAGRSPDADAGAVAADRVGPTVAGRRFHILRPHSRGGLGEVSLAFDGELNRTVALKELAARRAHDPDSQARFLREAEVTGRLEHPGIVPIYSMGRHEDGRPYYAMRFIEGETLRDAIERFHRAKGATPRDDVADPAFRRLLRSVIDVCNAVAYAHSRGVVHRDLKPDNVMLGPFGETLVVDWGVAKALPGLQCEGSEPDPSPMEPADASMTRPGSVIGTPRYMSPEQAMGDLERVGPASDIYSLGAILYCLLVGHAPFPDGDMPSVLGRVCRGIFPAPRRLRRSIDPTLEAICLKAMSLDPRDRHPTALDLGNDLEAWQADVRYRGEQELALGEARGSLTRFCLERARVSFDREAHAEGMLWLARALENAPAEPPDLQRVIRTSLCGWHAGAKLMERSLRHGGEVHAVAFCPEGRRLLTAGGDRTARLWDVSTGAPLSRPLDHEGPVRAAAFHPDGRSVATADDDGWLWRRDALTGEPSGVPSRHGGAIIALCFSPDGSTIAAVGGPGGFSLWDASTGLPVRGPDGIGTKATAVAFSPDATTIAVAGIDGGIRLLEAATGEPSGDPLNHGAAVLVLAFDPGGRLLLTGGVDGIARLWDLARRAATLSLPHPGAVHCGGFRPGGDTFATACQEGTARLWSSATGRPIGEPLAHRGRFDCLAFRPDGTMIATGSPDGTVRLWCAALGLPIGPPLAHGGSVRALAFSRDGRRLATGGSDALVRCWKVPDPIEGNADQVSCWVRIATDLEFDEGDAVRRMDGRTSWELRRRLAELGGPPPIARSTPHRGGRDSSAGPRPILDLF